MYGEVLLYVNNFGISAWCFKIIFALNSKERNLSFWQNYGKNTGGLL